MRPTNLLLAIAIFLFGTLAANGQPRASLVVASMEILAVTPTQPTQGQSFMVDYRISNVSILNRPVSGSVRATYGSSRQVLTTSGVPTILTIAPSDQLDGVLTFTAEASGLQTISVEFVTCPRIGGRRPAANCFGKGVRVIAAAEVDVTVIQDLVHMRIPGKEFIQFDQKDRLDDYTVKNGFLCVEHNPGCGVQGNDGTDGYLPTFPPGAIFEGVDFQRYYPEGLSNDIGGFPINDSGSYDATIGYAQPNTVPPSFPYVRWHNTCLAGSPAQGKSVYYAISFKVVAPRGTDLGPDAVPVDQSKSSTCSALPGFGIKVRDVLIKPRDYVAPASPIQIDWQISTYGACQPANVALFSKLHQEERKKIASLGTARSGSYSLNAPSTPGFIDYIVYAECSGADNFKDDRSATLQVAGEPVKTFNLRVDGPIITPSPPLVEKKPFSVQWTIANLGNAESPTFNVQLYLDKVLEGDKAEVKKLAPGESKTVMWDVKKELTESPHDVELKNADNGASLGYRSFMMIPAP